MNWKFNYNQQIVQNSAWSLHITETKNAYQVENPTVRNSYVKSSKNLLEYTDNVCVLTM